MVAERIGSRCTLARLALRVKPWHPRRTRSFLLSLCLCVSAVLFSAHAARADFLLISRDLTIQPVRLIAIDGERVHFLPDLSNRAASMPLDECLALYAASARPRAARGPLAQLADGQRFPGHPARRSVPADETLAWNHALLGELALPLSVLDFVVFERGASAPERRESDVLLLTNGDVLEGFIIELADPVVIEVETDGASREVEIPLIRVASARMVAQAGPGDGPRLWLADGTIVDGASLTVEEDGYVRFVTPWRGGQAATGSRVALTDVAGFLLDRAQLIALASLAPRHIVGQETRYEIPEPTVLDPDAVLGLAPIEFRGPLTARYALPAGATRFAAMAELPAGSRQWGDYELVLRDDERELLRTRLNAQQPEFEINVELQGRELTIEIIEGAHGPIQANLVLHRARLLVGR